MASGDGSGRLKKSVFSDYTIKDQFVTEALNGKSLRNIRKSMVSGQKVKGCEVCYLQESTGRSSNRQFANQEWTSRLGETRIQNLIDSAITSDGILKDTIVYLDLRLGSLCNLKCRMCSPWNSIQIAKEHIELEKSDSQYKKVWRKEHGKFYPNFLDNQEWFEQDIFWDQVISLIPNLHKVYMTGGEPTLIKNNFKFMQACIDQNRTDIVLFFNTNCTNINKNFLELIKQFKKVYINASIDGIENVNDYIRPPSNWKLINENVEKLAQMPNVELGITPTVQIYNVFNLAKIVEWVYNLNSKYNRDIFIDFLINVKPRFLSVKILPDELRHLAAFQLERYIKSIPNNLLPFLTKNSTMGIIELLKQSRDSDYESQLKSFKIYTESLDTARNQNIADVDQRLSDLIKTERIK